MDTIRHSTIHDLDAHRDYDEAFSGTRAASRPTVPAQSPAATAWYHDAAIEEARRDAVEARANPYAGALRH